MIIQSSGPVIGKSQVRFYYVDKLTKKPLPRFIAPWAPNHRSPLAHEVASRIFSQYIDNNAPGGPTGYYPTRIEWGSGTGMTGAPMDVDEPDLESGFSPKVFTNFTSIENPALGVAKFTSQIDTDSVDPGTNIQEVGLRTSPLSNHPNGILVARFQNTSPLPITDNRIMLVVEWVYLYILGVDANA